MRAKPCSFSVAIEELSVANCSQQTSSGLKAPKDWMLQAARIDTLVGQLIAAAVPEHVRVHLERDLGG
jgi:hypothetical protein